MVSTYTFAQSSGTFSTITGGTQLGNGDLDNQTYTVNLPTPFWFSGAYRSTAYVSANGFITFGLAPSGTNYTPISSNAGYAGAISAFGADIETLGSGSNREIRWQQTGDEIIFQWRRFRRNGVTEEFRFQIRLNTANGQISTVYQLDSGPGNGTSQQPEVGLRGSEISTSLHRNNRRVESGTETWATSLGGNAFNSKMRFTGSNPAKSFADGQTYTWTPPCMSPQASVIPGATDCAAGTFSVQVQVTALGGADNVDIIASPGGTLHSGVGLGTYVCGPFANGTPVSLMVHHTGNSACDLALGSFVNNVNCMANGACLSSPYMAIPDNGCGSGTALNAGIQISGFNTSLGTSVDLQSVELIVAHTNRSDLQIKLTSPTGQSRNLILNRGGSGDNFGNPSSCPSGSLTLDDNAASAISAVSGTSPTGSYRPEQTLAGFTGDPNGVWIVSICDNSNGTSGTLRHARLNFCDRPGAATASQVTDCLTNTFSVTVNVTAVHSAGVSIVATPGGTLQSNIGTGSYTVGPFANGTPVALKLSAPDACDLSIGSFVNNMDCIVNGQCYGATALPQIPDNGCGSNNYYEAGIAISGEPTSLGNAPLQARLESVDLIVAHTYRGDLRVHLVSPTGQQRDLFLRKPATSAGGDNLGDPSNCPGAILKLKDGAAALSTMNGSNNSVTGTFAPEQPLSDLTGDPNGTWIIRICDAAAQDVGRLRYVKLNFVTLDCAGTPDGPVLPGTACDDGNACTVNDVLSATCVCTGTFQDTDGDSTCDANDGCPYDPDKTAPGICGCGTADTDTDLDGTADCNDGCPEDPEKTTPGVCGCGTADTDTDLDGTADCMDGCPGDPDKISPGICGCDTPDTDTDSDGLADCEDPCPEDTNNGDSDGDGTLDCYDNCPLDPAKVNPGACGCGNPDTDSDGDGYVDCLDGCPNDPTKIGPGVCGCGTPETDTDGDGLLDCVDQCPLAPGQAGSPCDDGDPSTINDMLGADCACSGTPMEQPVTLQLTTDNDAASTSWEIVPAGGGAAVCAGDGYPNNSTQTIPCTLPDGCWSLRIHDAAMDGMCCMNGNGGYVLRAPDGGRIIDAAGTGIFGATAQETLGFCLPIGTNRITPSRCDREDYLPHDFIQAVPDPAVRAQYGVGDQTDDGYQFWFFNPNGGYSRRILVSHANSSYIFPYGQDRCSYLRLNTMVSYPLPLNTLLNVRVRSVINGAYTEFGPACRLKIDTQGNCPLTQLRPDAGPYMSCGLTGVLINGSTTLYAIPVSGANRYFFEFSKPGYTRNITMPTSSLNLTRWYTWPLEYNSTYNVRVKASYDDGVTYCPFGPSCTVSTASGPQGMAQEAEERGIGGFGTVGILKIWPNPNANGLLHVGLGGLGHGAHDVQVDIINMLGTTVQKERLNVDGDELNTVMRLNGGITAGTYTVRVVIGREIWTERLVIQ